MSGSKKYKPALIELVSKGTLKPRKGILGAPKWFYSGKPATKPAESSVPHETAPEPKTLPVVKPVILPTPEIQPEKENSVGIQVPASRKWLFGSEKAVEEPATQPRRKLKLSVSYWVIALVCLALFLGFLVMYRLGQMNRSPKPAVETENSADTPVSNQLEEIQNSPIREDLLSDHASADAGTQARPPVAVVQEIDPPKETAGSEAPAPPVVSAETEAGICLQICFNSNRRDLLPVQAHFSKNGIETLIGQIGEEYILYSKQTFEKKNSNEYVNLKEQIKKVGADYNREKPAAAVSYNSETFASAFAINVKDITK